MNPIDGENLLSSVENVKNQDTNIKTFEEKISEFQKSDFYHHYKNFFDDNIAVYQKLQEEADKKGKEGKNFKQMKKKLGALVDDITNLEISEGFHEISDEGRDFIRSSLEETLIANQQIDNERRAVSAGQVAKSAFKCLGVVAFTGAVAIGSKFIPFGGDLVEKAIIEGIVPVVTGVAMKDTILQSGENLFNDVKAKMNPGKYMEKNIASTMQDFDYTKWKDVYSNVAKPIENIGNMKDMTNNISTKYPEAAEAAQSEFKSKVDSIEKDMLKETAKAIMSHFPTNEKLKASTKEHWEEAVHHKEDPKNTITTHAHHVADYMLKKVSEKAGHVH